MAEKNRRLRSRIYSIFDTESECAKALNWPRQRLSKITNGEKIPSVNEIQEMSIPLQMSVGELAEFFLSRKSSIEPQENSA